MSRYSWDWENAPVRKHLGMVRDFAIGVFALGVCILWVYAYAV